MNTSQWFMTFIGVFFVMLTLAACGCTSQPTPTNPTHSFTPVETIVSVPTTMQSTPTPTIIPATTTPSPQTSVIITSPKDGSIVDYRTTIEGTSTGVYGTPVSIYVVILPQEDPEAEYWLQSDVTIQETGDWFTDKPAYFGRDATSRDSGKKFTVFVVTSTTKLTGSNMPQRPGVVKQKIEVTRR